MLKNLIKTLIFRGAIDFTDTLLLELDTMKLTLNDIKVSPEDEHENNEVCISNFGFGNITIYSKYHADLTIMNFPIYGNGEFS